jgi:hypothetical protein
VKKQRLMRTWYRTDVRDDEPDFIGRFTEPFPAETSDRRIVSVVWVDGPARRSAEVEVTWLITEDR